MSEQKQRCAICGSRFAEKKCYFCESKVCTSCIVPMDVSGSYSTAKCISCDRKKINRVSALSMLKRNYHLFGVIIAFWIYAIFPIPFMRLAGLQIDPTALQPVLIATG